MRYPSCLAVLIFMAGCASSAPSEPSGSAVAESPRLRHHVDECRRSIDSNFAAEPASPSRASTGLCNAKGAMTLCRTATDMSNGPMKPLGSLEVDREQIREQIREQMLEGCIAKRRLHQ